MPPSFPVHRWFAGLSPASTEPTVTTDQDAVAVEEPLEIRVNDRSVAVVMRTPGHDRELTAGFLLTEGIIHTADDLLDILPCRDQDGGAAGNVVNALTAPGVTVDFERLTRHVFSSSSCGVCGKATLDAVLQSYPPVSAGPTFDPARLAALPALLRTAQPTFAATGGLHACALFNAAGELDVVHEDVGRHNALDKVLGHALHTRRLPLADAGILFSGRIAFELVQKALIAGVPLIAGIGAPSSLAITCADRGGITLIGFLRPDRLNVYTHPSRLLDISNLKSPAPREDGATGPRQ